MKLILRLAVRTKLQLVQLKTLLRPYSFVFPYMTALFLTFLDVNERNSRGEAGRIGLDDVGRFGVVFVFSFFI